MSLSDSDFSDCDEAACYYPEGCQDLFSSKVFESPEKCLENAKLEHDIDFKVMSFRGL